jgi:hypothetical protein
MLKREWEREGTYKQLARLRKRRRPVVSLEETLTVPLRKTWIELPSANLMVELKLFKS